MSKGIGGLQRALLAAIQEHGCLDTLRAARHAYGVEPSDVVDGEPYHVISDAQHAATRRALGGLARRGLVVNLARHLGLSVRQRRYQNENGDWLTRVLWCTPRYAEDRARDRHCRHHGDPPPDPTRALSFWD
jgi:hypothetical protein